MKLSVIMPILNEARTIEKIIAKVDKSPLNKEIIIVDDGSTDGSRDILKNYLEREGFIIIFHEKNKGKGASIITAIQHISGEIVIIQDGDLEYDPNDYIELVKPIINKETTVVYGSRYLKKFNPKSYIRFYLGGRLLSLLSNILYNQNITDEPTCYKVFDADLLKSIHLESQGFGFCPEITAKVSKKGIKIKELPINYFPRKIKEGKKIKWSDGLEAIWILLKNRF